MKLEHLQKARNEALALLKSQTKIFDNVFKLYCKHRSRLEEYRHKFERADYRCAELDGRLKITPALDSDEAQVERTKSSINKILSKLTTNEKKVFLKEIETM